MQHSRHAQTKRMHRIQLPTRRVCCVLLAEMCKYLQYATNAGRTHTHIRLETDMSGVCKLDSPGCVTQTRKRACALARLRNSHFCNVIKCMLPGVRLVRRRV